MVWTTVDDFETGSLSGDWSGNNSFVVTSISPIEGTYSVAVDSDQGGYSANTRLVVINSATVSRNSNGDKTTRCLVKNISSTKSGSYISFIFFITDSDNYYKVKFTSDNNDDNIITLSKVVSGVNTILATHDFDDGGATQVQGIEVKAETNLITVFTYTDTSFSTSTGTDLTSSDTTYSSGEIGFDFFISSSPDQGIFSSFRWDLIETFSGEEPTATTRKIKISGTFQDKPIKTKVGGSFVDKPIKIKVGGTFQ